MLTAEQELTLTCSAMGTPRSQISWYTEDSHIFNSSEIETDIGANTLVSMLVVSSVKLRVILELTSAGWKTMPTTPLISTN